MARNSALIELAAKLKVSRQLDVSLAYQGQFGTGLRDHAGQLRAGWRF